MVLSFPLDFCERLSAHRPGEGSQEVPARRAAVAIIFKAENQPQILLMRRVESPSDPWSGQISLPGGRAEDGDDGLLATAQRETREETGLALEKEARLLCVMAPLPAVASGKVLAMDITPHVFVLREEVFPCPGEEAEELFWFPLNQIEGGTMADTHRLDKDGMTLSLPAWRYEGREIWGLTHRMVQRLIDVVAS